MTHRIYLLVLFIGLVIGSPLAVYSQPAGSSHSSESVETLEARAAAALDSARRENLDVLAPRHFGRAQDAYTEARSLVERRGENELITIKFKLAVDEVATARQTAALAREKLAEVLAARTAALASGADTLSRGLWDRSEDRFRDLVHDVERAPSSVDSQAVTDMAGAYRAARRDALRASILQEARNCIDDIERRGGSRTVPSLVLRAQQAVSRAEADLAQENLDGARADAQAAIRTCTHALALMNYIAAAQKAKQPWEAALLPYDDMLVEIASHLSATLDLSRGGAPAGPQILGFIDARQESLATQVVTQAQTQKSLESSLAEAQTALADAQARIAELERRLQSAEGERSSARQSLAKTTVTADRIARAQEIFKPGEAQILQNADGTVTIRLTGLKYGSGATNLDKARQRVVDRAVQAIQQFPGAALRVEGHTDAEGGAEANQKLSEARAQTVAAYLAQKLKLPPDQVQAYGYGETQPVASNDTADGRARNRRIDLILTLPE